MEYFVQQLINGFILGSIYGLIAIGYIMVYSIFNIINFTHGDIFMIGAFMIVISLVFFGLTVIYLPLTLLFVLVLTMIFISYYGYTIKKLAYF